MNWVGERYPEEDAHYVGPEYGPTSAAVQESFAALKERILLLADPEVLAQDQRSVVESEKARAALRAIRLPERFLFGRLTWAMPYPGLEICVTWNKPD